jgi:pimeloyl-ACP methyl ester carboxylesterase
MNLILSFIPAKFWWSIGGAVALGLLAWLHQIHAGNVVLEAVAAERAEMASKAASELQEARIDAIRIKTAADMAALEITHEYQTKLAAARADSSRAGTERDKLQHLLANLRSGKGATGESLPAGSIADAAGAISDSLSECSGRYQTVAGERDSLSVQVTGLQGYITRSVGPVCIAGLAPDSGSGSPE